MQMAKLTCQICISIDCTIDSNDRKWKLQLNKKVMKINISIHF